MLLVVEHYLMGVEFVGEGYGGLGVDVVGVQCYPQRVIDGQDVILVVFAPVLHPRDVGR